jgi:hypothetical protein
VRTATLTATSTEWIRGETQPLASSLTYREGEAVVDRLADSGFPVRHLRIVGRDLYSVEHITRSQSVLRSAGAGTASGAWFGLLIGLLLSVFLPGVGGTVMLLSGLVYGAVWGAFFGFVAHWLTHGRRDFASHEGLVAASYDVLVDRPHANSARQLLADAI